MSRYPAHNNLGEAITKLLSDGFVPRRTIILSHGNDEEEVFARRGQGHIAPFLEERYGKDGLLMVIDEGSGNKDDVSLHCDVY
jgi:Gly-Xaa carboxypeptidase